MSASATRWEALSDHRRTLEIVNAVTRNEWNAVRDLTLDAPRKVLRDALAILSDHIAAPPAWLEEQLAAITALERSHAG